jgi:hypothetical protein
MKRSTSSNRSIWFVLILFFFLGDLVNVYSQPKTVKKVSEDLLPAIPKSIALQRTAPRTVLQKKDLVLRGTEADMTLIEAISDGNTDQLLADLKKLGLKNAIVYGKKINGYLPLTEVYKLEGVKNLVFAEPVYKPLLNSGKAYTNGDKALRADVIRTSRGLDGKGVKVGVLSDSYNSLKGAAEGVLNDELPGEGNPNGYKTNVEVLEDVEDGSDEGRAMCEIIHDVSPAAEIAFHTAYLGTASFAQGIIDLADAGCEVITDDVSYFNEPFFQDGIIAQAVDKVVKDKGVSYYSSAGNSDRNSYSSEFRNGGTYTIYNPYTGYEIGRYVMHDFDPGPGVDIFQEIVFAPGDDFTCSFQWSDPFASVCEGCPGAKSDLDFFIALSKDTADIILESVNSNIDGDAVEILGASSSDSIKAYVAFGRWVDAPGPNPNPAMVKYVNFGTAVPTEYITNSPTVKGHANTKNGVSVGAAFWRNTPEFGKTPPRINYFSSAGSTPILFDIKGKKLKTPEVRMNPLFTATDGGNTSFFGQQINDDDTLPNFFGTSASAPHAAAVTAQLRQMANGRVSAKKIDQILSQTAIDMDDPFTTEFDKGYDKKTGYGLIQADKAAKELLKIVGIKSLTLIAECSDKPEQIRNWKITNPNPFAVKLRWELLGTSQVDTILAYPGDTHLSTKTNPYFNLMAIGYKSPYGDPIIRVAFSPGCKCSKLKSTGDDAIDQITDEEPTIVIGTYPNPFASHIKLDLYNGSSSDITVKVYNAQGVEVFTRNIDPIHGYTSTEINLADLKKGIYIMKVTTADGKLNESVKLFKQ